MRTIVAALLLCLCVGCASAEEDGTLVMSIGSIGPELSSYQLLYKRFGEGIPFLLPYVGYNPGGLFSPKPDFSDRETGMVRVMKLSPGTYEFYTVILHGRFEEWRPNEHFSLPFVIEAGKTTYLGDFAAVTLVLDNRPVGAYFVVTDKHERDIEIAKRKEPALPPVTIAIPDVDRLHADFFKSRE